MSPEIPGTPATSGLDGRPRSRVSGLPAGEEHYAVQGIVQDLTAGRETLDEVLAAYDRTVPDPLRRRRAASVVDAAASGRLESESDLARLIEVIYFSGHQPLLAKHQLLFPPYRIREEYFVNANAASGPLTPR